MPSHVPRSRPAPLTNCLSYAAPAGKHVVGLPLPVAALLRCALDDEERRTGDSAEGDEGGRWVGEERVTSAATVSRQCAAIMKACVGQGWEAEVNLQHWLRELERLKVRQTDLAAVLDNVFVFFVTASR